MFQRYPVVCILTPGVLQMVTGKNIQAKNKIAISLCWHAWGCFTLMATKGRSQSISLGQEVWCLSRGLDGLVVYLHMYRGDLSRDTGRDVSDSNTPGCRAWALTRAVPQKRSALQSAWCYGSMLDTFNNTCTLMMLPRTAVSQQVEGGQ